MVCVRHARHECDGTRDLSDRRVFLSPLAGRCHAGRHRRGLLGRVYPFHSPLAGGAHHVHDRQLLHAGRGAVNEAFLRIDVLLPYYPQGMPSPVFGMVHSVVGVGFVVLLVALLRRQRQWLWEPLG